MVDRPARTRRLAPGNAFPGGAVPPADVSRTPLAERLTERIEREGPIPLQTFMETALYDPEHGYYAQPGFTTGRKGDFATAPDVGELLGATVANPVERFARDGGRLVEIGPGSGRLIVDVIEHLPRDAAEQLEVVLVEPFEAHRGRLVERVEAAGIEPRIVSDLAELEPDRTLVLANELLDALPAEVVRRRSDGLERMTVGTEDGFTGTFEPAPDELAEAVHKQTGRLPVDHRYEFSPSLEELLGDLADVLDPGAALVFDYGDRFEEIWPTRADGTLRGFRDHRQVDPLTRPGETDVTYDVDFTRTMDLAGDEGLDVRAFGPQERMLVHLGLMEAAREADAFLQAKQLLVPGAFAGRFMALVLGEGGVAEDIHLKVDLDDPGLWDRGLTEPLGEMEGDLGRSLKDQMEQANEPFDLDR